MVSNTHLGSIWPALALALLTGCASFTGAPKQVVSANDYEKLLKTYPLSDAVTKFHASDNNVRGGLSPRQWRDMIITIYMGGMDRKYRSFRASISEESKGSNVLLEGVVLGAAGGASVAGQATANALAVVAAGATGVKGVLNKELYYEKTLPAILAAMDGSRLTVKSRILNKISEFDEKDYPLEAALAELDEYEGAATFERAVQQVTVDSAVGLKAAQDKLDVAYVAGVPTENARQLMAKIKAKIVTWATKPDLAQLKLAFSVSGANPSVAGQKPDKDKEDLVSFLARNRYNAKDLQDFIDKMNAASPASEQIQ